MLNSPTALILTGHPWRKRKWQQLARIDWVARRKNLCSCARTVSLAACATSQLRRETTGAERAIDLSQLRDVISGAERIA